MVSMPERLILIHERRLPDTDLNRELQWVGHSLGLFSLRDRDSSCFRVFITLVRSAKKNQALSSDEIAERLHLSRGTVVHHLIRLRESGIVVHEKEGYILRESTLQNVVRSIERDFAALFEELQQMARQIDEQLG